jgi:hypothetical protein
MPLSPPAPRQLLNRREITCEGFQRDDGLIDVEGRLRDSRGYDIEGQATRSVKQGDAVHDMWVRLTLDETLTVREVDCATDATPYETCHLAAPNMQRLLGISVAAGFKKEVRSRIGRTAGCTHIVSLIDAMATVAMHAMVAARRHHGRDAVRDTFEPRADGAPPLLDSCISLASDSPVVQRLYPEYYRPKG